jgi:hypothetical protein
MEKIKLSLSQKKRRFIFSKIALPLLIVAFFPITIPGGRIINFEILSMFFGLCVSVLIQEKKPSSKAIIICLGISTTILIKVIFTFSDFVELITFYFVSIWISNKFIESDYLIKLLSDK